MHGKEKVQYNRGRRLILAEEFPDPSNLRIIARKILTNRNPRKNKNQEASGAKTMTNIKRKRLLEGGDDENLKREDCVNQKGLKFQYGIKLRTGGFIKYDKEKAMTKIKRNTKKYQEEVNQNSDK